VPRSRPGPGPGSRGRQTRASAASSQNPRRARRSRSRPQRCRPRRLHRRWGRRASRQPLARGMPGGVAAALLLAAPRGAAAAVSPRTSCRQMSCHGAASPRPRGAAGLPSHFRSHELRAEALPTRGKEARSSAASSQGAEGGGGNKHLADCVHGKPALQAPGPARRAPAGLRPRRRAVQE